MCCSSFRSLFLYTVDDCSRFELGMDTLGDVGTYKFGLVFCFFFESFLLGPVSQTSLSTEM